jgi:Beta propeller domain
VRARPLVGLALAALLGLSGATALETAEAAKKRTRVAKKTRLKAFRSCAQLARYGRHHVRRGPGAQPPPPVGLPGPPVRMFGGPAAGGEAEPGAAPVTQREGSSTTNVQEQGVDEPDAVKSRGSLVFAIAGNQLHAIDASGAAPKLLGSLPVEGFGHELLLFGDRLLVFSRTFGAEPEPLPGPRPAQAVGSPIYGNDTTLLTEVDGGDPAAMRIVRTEKVPGSFVSARLTGRTARVVVSAPSPGIYEPSLRGRVAGWMPRRVLTDAASGRSSSRRLAPCRRVRRPVAFSGLDLLTVLTVDMSKGLPAVDSDAIESGGEIVYASPRGLYVATQRWTDQPNSSSEEPPRTFTAIHHFDASEPGRTSYRASGRVPGYLLNQFSMSEHEGALRVASTETPTWWGANQADEGQSFVTTLDRSGPALLQLGQVGGLGKGERIFAVRFIEDAGFVVTFRQIDPLYALDLADPRSPRVLGELKILGYSAYLHPLRNNRLLGVGQDATEEGQRQGTQLSLFDISDLRSPRRIHQRPLGFGSSSEAEYDHHAFLYWRPARLAVLPVQSQDLVGAAGFTVSSAAGINEVGRASHPQAPVRRALVVGGRLYTLSDEGLEQDSLTSLAEEAWLPLPARP